MTDKTNKQHAENPDQQGPTQQQLDPLAGGDRAAADAFRKPGQGNASSTAANPPAAESDAKPRNKVDPRASPPFAKG